MKSQSSRLMLAGLILGILVGGCSQSTTGADAGADAGAELDGPTPALGADAAADLRTGWDSSVVVEAPTDAPAIADAVLPAESTDVVTAEAQLTKAQDASAETSPREAGPEAADVPGVDEVGQKDLASENAATADASKVDSEGEASTSGSCSDPLSCTGSNWAQWPMPNGAADVAGGAPNPTTLFDNGDDTVTDAVTGLMWQRSATVTRYTREEASARCQKLRLGGHADWRMPSVIELTSIIDFDRSSPSIDGKFFPDTPLDRSSSLVTGYEITSSVAETPVAGWLVNFAFGTVSLDTTSYDRPAYLRCVRGARAPNPDTAQGRYDLSTDGIAVDVKTSLSWQRVAGTRRRFSDAKAYCATGTGLPGTGWRLPTIKELMTIVDFAKPNKYRLDETVFNVSKDVSDSYGVVWSSTSLAGKPPYAQFDSGIWSVYFDRGESYYIDSTSDAFVRCVR